jgi:anthranilate synthase component 1
MDILPAAAGFSARYDKGVPQLVWTTLVGDLETPVSAFLKLCSARPNSFLLESVEGGAVRGRYSILGLAPDTVWRCMDGKAEINRNAGEKPDAFVPCAEPALEALRAFLNESKLEIPPELPPMAAGVFGYLGYETVRLMERLADPKPNKLGMPDAILLRPTVLVIFDAVRDSITVITPVRPETGVPAAQAYETARDRLRAPRGRSPTHRRSGSRRWCARRRSTFSRATFSRRSSRSASRRRSRCRPSRSIARSAA